MLYTGGSVFNKFSEGDRKQIQLLLKNSKVYPGKIDGERGKSTSNGVGAAIRFIQKSNNFDDNLQNDVLNKLGITKMCCRRHFLGHVDLINNI